MLGTLQPAMNGGEHHEQKRSEQYIGQQLPPEQGEKDLPSRCGRRKQHGGAKEDHAIEDC
jgi:hypothetical protein